MIAAGVDRTIHINYHLTEDFHYLLGGLFEDGYYQM